MIESENKTVRDRAEGAERQNKRRLYTQSGRNTICSGVAAIVIMFARLREPRRRFALARTFFVYFVLFKRKNKRRFVYSFVETMPTGVVPVIVVPARAPRLDVRGENE